MRIAPQATKVLTYTIVLFLLFPVLAFADLSADIQDGSQLNNSLQSIIFSADNLGSAGWYDVDERTLLVNGVDQTPLTAADYDWDGSFTITYTPTTDNPLPQGDVTIQLTIPHSIWMFWHFWDTEEEALLSVFVDSVPPEIARVSPTAGETITDLQQPLVFSILDSGSGIDSGATVFYINNEEKTALTTFTDNQLVYTPNAANPLPDQDFQVKIVTADQLGNTNEAVFEIHVETLIPLTATPVAIPQTAYAPVTIHFSPEVTTGNAIQTYRWDFDGNGTYDSTDIIGNSYTHTYSTPGDYTISLQVVDNLGEVYVGTTVVHILNKAPDITVEASPSNGEIPLTVSFTVTASDNEGINQYEWDFEGDGTYDYISTSTGNTNHTYVDPGDYSAILRITDGAGESTIFTLPTTTVRAAATGSPTVTATTNVASGNVPLTVTLGATATDPKNKTFTLWEWDFEGDGIYDYTDTADAAVSHVYDTAGSYYPTVRVTTEDGRTSIDAVEVKVVNTLSLSRDVDTIDSFLGETATITTTLGGTTEVSLVIEDRTMQVVRTLVDWTERSGGTYSDTWDGRRNDNSYTTEGDYYAVLLYKEDNQTKRLDLRETSGGTRYNPSRNNAARSFSPFDNDPMLITFTLPYASEVTAFIGYSVSNTRVTTFMSRKPLSKGNHTVLWYGTNNEGALITPPPGKYFMFGVWAYSLANNAIYIKSGAHVHSVSVTPPIYDPTSHEEEGLRAKSRISFTLTSPASVELKIADAQSGTLAATRIYKDLPAGENTIEWDGKNSSNEFLSPGKYRLGVRTIDANGYRSLMEYTLQRIYY